MSLEAFLDKSILFGFSFGINKAEVCVAEGRLLGHKIGRNGSAPDEERCQAVVDFPPLKEKLHTQQFLGCANGSVGTSLRSTVTQPRSLASGRSQGQCSRRAGWVQPPPRDARPFVLSKR